MHSETSWRWKWSRLSLKRCMSPVIDYDTSHRGHRHLEIAQLLVVFMKVASCFWSSCLYSLVILSALYPGVFQNHYLKYIVLCLSVCLFCNELIFLLSSPSLPPIPRFADSIRGMLKLILVLMLAGASLSSTWFTLTCLSRFTHLPSTAGGSTAASLSRWHRIRAVQLGDSEPKWIQLAVQGSYSAWFAKYIPVCKY